MQNSTIQRIVSGTIANWINILLGIVSQVVTVPVFLSVWDIQTYGQWLALTSMFVFIQLIDGAHQTYIGYEVLKIGVKDKNLIEKTLFSGMIIAILIGLVQLVILSILLYYSPFVNFCLDHFSIKESYFDNIRILLISFAGMWALFGSVGGILVRGLSPFGYYPKMAWWGVYINSVVIFTPAIGAWLGYSLFTVGLFYIIAIVLVNIHLFLELFKVYSKLELSIYNSSFRFGLENFLKAQFVIFKNALETIKIQGIRLILTPLVGLSGLATFSTMRTGSNAAMQGMNTVINPIMPELMRYIHERNQKKVEVIFSTIWIALVFLMVPATILLQACIEPLFTLWTNGRVLFIPQLFALLSMSVLFYTISQPAIAVVNGNNLVKSQFILTLISVSSLVILLFALVPFLGLTGAGYAIFLTELFAAIGYIYMAFKWLKSNDLSWPFKPFYIAIQSIILTFVTIETLLIWSDSKWIILIISFLALYFLMQIYWKTIPSEVIERVKKNFDGIFFRK